MKTFFEAVFILLVMSLLLNLLLFRWGVQERANRREWQQEALALQNALKRVDSRSVLAGSTRSVAPWMVLGLIVMILFLALVMNF